MIIHEKNCIKNLQTRYNCETKLQGQNPKSKILYLQMINM